jgi:soluble lytic murein transglycosylase-like protein
MLQQDRPGIPRSDAQLDRESRVIRIMKITRLPLARLLLIVGVCLPFLARAAPSAATEGLEIPAPGKISSANKRKLKPLIEDTAKRYGLDKDLVHAVIAAESGYNPKAVSPAGAIGLMQVMPATAADYGVDSTEELFDPKVNLDTGSRHLKRLLRKYSNIRQAVMAYNAGEGALDSNLGLVPYDETRRYTIQVINNYWVSKGKKPLNLRELGLTGKKGRIRLVINSTVRNLDPGLHSFGPDSKPMFVLESKD